MTRIPACNRVLAFLLCLTTIGAASSVANAQSRRRQPTPPPTPAQTNQPAQQADPNAPNWDDLEPSPYIKRTQPKRWTANLDYRIGSSQELLPNGELRFDVWQFDTATLVFPAVGETASSILEVRGPFDAEVPAIDGSVELADIKVSEDVTIRKQGIAGGPLPCGTWRAQWQVPALESGHYSVREMEFKVSVAQTCYQTQFDERGASEIDWPKGPWPPDAAATFQPQMFVDYDMTGNGYDMSIVVGLLREWAEGRDVEEMRKQAKPVPLAKWLAGKAVEHVQLSGQGLAFDKTGLWQGFDTAGAVAAAAEGRGTPIDLPCLLVALYRAVGLPARVVIGLDREAEGKDVYLVSKSGGNAVRVWVEFGLYDEANKTFGWVPVDVTAIRQQSSRMPNGYLNRPLRYFGTHPDLDQLVPLAFHFHPPTTVRSYGSPALWGWFVTPTPPARAVQQVRFNVSSTPRGGSNESRLPKPKD